MAGAGVIQKAAFGDVYDARIKKQFLLSYGPPENEFEKFYRTEDISEQDIRYSYQSGFGLWNRKADLELVTYDTVYQGYDTTITPWEYASGFQIGQQAYEDDKTGLLQGLVGPFAESARDTLEYLGVAPFINATSTTAFSPYMSGGDGVALLSTLHPIPAGGVFANTPASGTDLSIAAVSAGRIAMMKTPNARGLRRGVDATTLVVPIDSYYLAKELFGQGADNMPYTADNTANVVKEGLEIVRWTGLTDTNAWFLMAKKAAQLGMKGHCLTYVNRIGVEFDRSGTFDSGARLYKGRFRVGFGYPDPRGIYGSLGSS